MHWRSVSLTAQRVYETIVTAVFMYFLSAGCLSESESCDETGRGDQFFSSFKVLKEEGYLKIATNSFARKKASDSEKGGNGE